MIRDYYMVDGAALGEKNTKWLQDDYVKFTRLGQFTINSSGIGVFSFITNHGYIDNPTYRGMRQQLINTFQKLFVLDLHGNSNKQESSPDGSKDVNVFEIQQGVAILTAIKNKFKASVLAHGDLFGLRENKYEYLLHNTVSQTSWNGISPVTPFYHFMPQDVSRREEYDHFVGVQQIFQKTLLGPNSHRDDFAISFEYEIAQNRLNDLADKSKSDEKIREKYSLSDNRDWSLKVARSHNLLNATPVRCIYRPFDFRWMLYGPYAFDYHRPEINDHLLKHNLALISTRQTKDNFSVFVTATPAGQHKLATPYDGSYLSPLFLYQKDLINDGERQTNFDPRFQKTIIKILGVSFPPEDIFNYIYAILSSPEYRTRYAEFLKIDFPRVPLTSSLELFRSLAKLGSELIGLHLLESPTVNSFITTFTGKGDNSIPKKPTWKDNAVWINPTQRFEGVPENVWNFHIGGYQVCEKWLKDRKGRTLSEDDIIHYQRIVVALNETIRIMAEIDQVIDEHGGWPIK